MGGQRDCSVAFRGLLVGPLHVDPARVRGNLCQVAQVDLGLQRVLQGLGFYRHRIGEDLVIDQAQHRSAYHVGVKVGEQFQAAGDCRLRVVMNGLERPVDATDKLVRYRRVNVLAGRNRREGVGPICFENAATTL